MRCSFHSWLQRGGAGGQRVGQKDSSQNISPGDAHKEAGGTSAGPHKAWLGGQLSLLARLLVVASLCLHLAMQG